MKDMKAKRKKMLAVVSKLSKIIKKDLKKAASKGYKLDSVLRRMGGHRGFEGAAADINQGIEDAIEALEDAPGMVREFFEDMEYEEKEKDKE